MTLLFIFTFGPPSHLYTIILFVQLVTHGDQMADELPVVTNMDSNITDREGVAQ